MNGRWIAVIVTGGVAAAGALGGQDATPTPVKKPAAASVAGSALAKREATIHGAAFARRVSLAELSTTSVGGLGADFKAHALQVRTKRPVEIVAVETGDSKVAVAAGTKYASDTLVSVPIKGNELTIEAKAASGRVFWTGVGIGGGQPPSTMMFSLTDSPGCEITVESDPPGATVFFNDNEWEHHSNTTSIRDPGAWTVRLSMPGYLDWTGTRALGPSETWRISAVYPKKTTKKKTTKKSTPTPGT